MAINKEDYEEPRCALCMKNPNEKEVIPIDMRRVTEKLDDYLNKQQWAAAEKHLEYWLETARFQNDLKGEFSVQNEIMGLKRKLGKKDDALNAASEALKLSELLGNTDSVGGSTVFVNCGTVYEAFDMADDAVLMYKKAQPVYEKYLKEDSPKLGGLYNNLAMALALTGDFDEAFLYYNKAIEVMGKVENGKIEQALTYLNMADAYQAQLGLEEAAEKVDQCLDTAQKLLDDPGLPHSGYYAYMADKCVECFRYHGYFFYANELENRVKAIYERLKA